MDREDGSFLFVFRRKMERTDPAVRDGYKLSPKFWLNRRGAGVNSKGESDGRNSAGIAGNTWVRVWPGHNDAYLDDCVAPPGTRGGVQNPTDGKIPFVPIGAWIAPHMLAGGPFA